LLPVLILSKFREIIIIHIFYSIIICVRISPEKLDEVRNAIDIVDLIGAFLPLKKRGKSYIGLCPFHVEKTPSFNVSPERQMYHCFGCGVGGNAITFVMDFEKVSFLEAVRSLAEKAGIVLPQDTAEDGDRASEQEQLYQVCREAGLFFYKNLTEAAEGKYAWDYFRKRGFTDETIRTFGLGYSMNAWESFIGFSREKNIPIELAEKAGLVRKRDDGSYHDYFRGRGMFPIFSATGRVVGFGARKLREDDPLGKYLNSPETLIYNKSKILYGIYQAKDAIREKDFVILVEGYADLITTFQLGVKNVVASSGTALTQEQIQLISRYTKNITIMYDADSAGSKAALRGVDLVLENDLDVRVAPLPEGDDPDSFIRKNGVEAFRKLIDGAVSFIDFIAQSFEKQGKLETPEGQAKTVRAIVQSIAKMKDELKRNFYIRQVAEKYRLYESTLMRELEKIIGTGRRSVREQSNQAVSGFEAETTNGFKPDGIDMPVVERDLIHAMLDGGEEVVTLISKHLRVTDFAHPQSRKLVETLLRHLDNKQPIDPAVLLNEVEEQTQSRFIANLVFSKYHLSKGWDESRIQVEQADPRKIAKDAITIIRKRALERTIEENQRLLKSASQRGENVLPILERHQQLLAEIKELELKSYDPE